MLFPNLRLELLNDAWDSDVFVTWGSNWALIPTLTQVLWRPSAIFRGRSSGAKLFLSLSLASREISHDRKFSLSNFVSGVLWTASWGVPCCLKLSKFNFSRSAPETKSCFWRGLHNTKIFLSPTSTQVLKRLSPASKGWGGGGGPTPQKASDTKSCFRRGPTPSATKHHGKMIIPVKKDSAVELLKSCPLYFKINNFKWRAILLFLADNQFTSIWIEFQFTPAILSFFSFCEHSNHVSSASIISFVV